MELEATSRVPLTKVLQNSEFRILEPIKTDKYQKIRLPSSYFFVRKIPNNNYGSYQFWIIFSIFSKWSVLIVVVLRGCSNVLKMDMIFQETNYSRQIHPVIHNL